MDIEVALFGRSACTARLSASGLATAGGDRLRFTAWSRLRGTRGFSAAIVGELDPDPLRSAQNAHRLNRDAPVLILREPDELEEVSRKIFLTPNIGQDTRVLPTGDDTELAGEIRSSADRAVRRERYREQTRAAMARLASAATPPAPELLSTDLLLAHLPTGVIAVDDDQHLLMCNPAAGELLGLASPEHWHHPWCELLPAQSAPLGRALVNEAMRTDRVQRQVIMAGDEDSGRLYLEITAAARPGGDGAGGAMILLVDVTERIRADLKRAHSERLLADANKHLERRVSERTRELEQAKRQLEARNAELQRLYGIEEVNKAKSRFVSTISHEIRTPLHAILGLLGLLEHDNASETQLHRMRMIRESAENLRALIDDILDFSKLEAGQLELEPGPLSVLELCESIADTVGAAAHEKGLCMRLFVDPDIPEQLLGDAGRLRQILLNLAGNAVKFTPRGDVSLRCELVDVSTAAATLRFGVEDTGIGIPEAARERIFERFMQAEISTTRRFGGTGLGLSICRALVDAMHGQLEFESTPDRGSRFTFTVSLKRALAPTGTSQQQPPLHGMTVRISSRRDQEADDWGRYIEVAGARRVDNDADAVIEDLSGHADLRVMVRGSRGTALLERPVRQQDLVRALLQQADYRAAPPVEPERPAAPAPLSGHVLIAEDNPVNQKVIQLQLERLGIQATIVDDGAAALDALADQSFDLLLADLHMPAVDGFELARTVRQREQAGRQTPIRIIALTASVDRSELDHCRAAGMDDVMTKPASLEELAAKLRQWLPEPNPD